jgi:hypothetical protein
MAADTLSIRRGASRHRAANAKRAAASGIRRQRRGVLKSLLLSQLGHAAIFAMGLEARSACIEIVWFFGLGSFCHFAVPPFSGQTVCLISLGRLGCGKSSPLKSLTFLALFCSRAAQ